MGIHLHQLFLMPDQGRERILQMLVRPMHGTQGYQPPDYLINVADREGNCPLVQLLRAPFSTSAVQYVTLLLQQRADPRPAFLFLASATTEPNRAFLESFLRCIANRPQRHQRVVEARDACGRTALLRALQRHDGVHAHMLLRAGFPMDVCDNAGRTVLMYAVLSPWSGALAAVLSSIAGRPLVGDTIQQLTDAFDWVIPTSLVEARDHQGRTALQLASTEGSETNVRMLLHIGADISSIPRHAPVRRDTSDALREAYAREAVLLWRGVSDTASAVANGVRAQTVLGRVLQARTEPRPLPRVIVDATSASLASVVAERLLNFSDREVSRVLLDLV